MRTIHRKWLLPWLCGAVSDSKRRLVLFVPLLCLVVSALFAQTAAERGFAEEDFRRGVQAYYRGSFNDAVLQFEKALANLPDDDRILDWLGKAYYRVGMEGSALEQWRIASGNGYGGALLESWIEIVGNRRILSPRTVSDRRYVEMTNYAGESGGILYFSYPVSILPNPDGSFYLVAFGSDELLCYDANGHIRTRYNGPLNGFDRPMDILRLSDGTLVISEYAGDRLSFLNENFRFLSSVGSTGRGDGQFLGPQYLALDSSENIYVTDFGNSRVSVFSREGEYLFSFGKFTAPTGIAVYQDLVYVADAVTGAVYEYDTAGNFRRVLVNEGTLLKPEAIRVCDGRLVAADTNRVLVIHPETGAVTVIADMGSGQSRITCADVDVNGNLVAADFDSGEVYVLAEMAELVGGLHVEISRVNADSFPTVLLELRVQNRKRQPVVGLGAENFFVTEGSYNVAGQTFLGSADLNEECDITIILDRSSKMSRYEDDVRTAVTEIARSMNGKGTLRIVSSGAIPVTELVATPESVLNFHVGELKTAYSADCSHDLAIRLAANDLVNAGHKRAIVWLGNGESKDSCFSRYPLATLSAYLANNGISFSYINVLNTALHDQFAYLVDSTPGGSYYLYRPEGISQVVADLTAIPTGIYTLRYTSGMPTDFGRSYLPVEVETYLMNRSGRGETGYFAPLE